MIKQISFLIIFFISIMSVNANNNLVTWEFEEGSGSIVLDSSGNSNHGINSENNKYRGNSCAFGLYCLDFDGNNDFVISLTQSPIPNVLTLSLMSYRKDKANVNNIWLLGDTTQEHFLFNYDNTLQAYTFGYLDNTSIMRTITLESITEGNINNQWINLLTTIDYTDNSVKFWRDGTLIYNQTQSFTFFPTDNDNKLRLGGNFDLANDYKGWYDNLNIYDFELNTTQISLLNTNGILNNNELGGEEDNGDGNGGTPTDPLNITFSNIINSTTPIDNSIINNEVSFEVLLNLPARCDLYVDNDLVYTTNNVLAFTHDILYLDEEEHNYFVYCEYTQDGTLYKDSTDIITFTTTLGNKAINFNLFDPNDNLLLGENLYLTTPCFEEFGMFNKLVDNMAQDLNKDGIFYIQNLKNGNAQFNLSYTNNYEFCLVRGQVNYAENGYSNNFNIVDFGKQIELGNLYVNNETLVFNFRVDAQDINNVYEPSFWGKTIESLFNLIFFTIIGGFLVFLGVRSDSEKLMMAGAIIIMAGAGVSIGTFFGFLG